MAFDMHISGEQVVYGRVEISFKKECPIDYVTVLTPSGKTERISPFKKRSVEFAYSEEGWESARVGEDFLYACRYTPDEVGEHRLEAWRDGVCLATESIRIGKGKTQTLGFVRNRRDLWLSALRDGKNASAVEQISLPIEANAVTLYPIWTGDTTHFRIEKSRLMLTDLLYGVLLRIR